MTDPQKLEKPLGALKAKIEALYNEIKDKKIAPETESDIYDIGVLRGTKDTFVKVRSEIRKLEPTPKPTMCDLCQRNRRCKDKAPTHTFCTDFKKIEEQPSAFKQLKKTYREKIEGAK